MSNEFKSTFGQRIKELRLAEGYTQEQLSEKLEIERTYLARIETGKHFPSADNIEKFLQIFKLSPSELFNTAHFKTKETLIKEILSMLNDFEIDKIRYIYKSVINLKSLKNQAKK